MYVELTEDEVRSLGIVPRPKGDHSNTCESNQLRAMLGFKPLRVVPLCKYCGENVGIVQRPFSDVLNNACIDCRACLPHHEKIKHQVIVHNGRRFWRLNDLTLTEWCKKIIASKGCCHYCNEHVGYEKLILEHLVPMCKGGRTTASNVVPACKKCNGSKGRKLPHQWKPEVYGNPIQSESVGVADAAPISEAPQDGQ